MHLDQALALVVHLGARCREQPEQVQGHRRGHLLLDPEERSEEDEEEEVGACAGDGSSWTCWVRSCCTAWTAGGAATGTAAAAPRAGVHAVPAVRSLFLERDLRFWNQ